MEYKKPQMEITVFVNEDVITTSGTNLEDDTRKEMGDDQEI